MRGQGLHGFTLIEVLVAIAVFMISIYFVDALVASMRLNSTNMGALRATESIQDVFERTAAKFRSPATYGVLAAADKPVTLDGYSWTVTVCEASTTSDTCVNAVNLTPTSYAYTAASTVKNLRMTVTYTPTIALRGRVTKAALELARP